MDIFIEINDVCILKQELLPDKPKNDVIMTQILHKQPDSKLYSA